MAVGHIQAEIVLHMQTPYLRVELQGMPTPIKPFNKLEVMFRIPVRSPLFPFKFIQLKGRPSVDVIEAMTGKLLTKRLLRLRFPTVSSALSSARGAAKLAEH